MLQFSELNSHVVLHPPKGFIKQGIFPHFNFPPREFGCQFQQNSAKMSAKYVIPAVLGSFAISWVFYDLAAHKKIFGGTVPHTVADKGWWEETDKKFQAWPREAGPPVVMNPISRQNFIVKTPPSSE